jgi:transposase
MLHRTRALLIRQQTMLANAFRAHLAEFGFVVPQGIRHVRTLSRYSASDTSGDHDQNQSGDHLAHSRPHLLER